jgi:hypothetical protein
MTKQFRKRSGSPSRGRFPRALFRKGPLGRGWAADTYEPTPNGVELLAGRLGALRSAATVTLKALAQARQRQRFYPDADLASGIDTYEYRVARLESEQRRLELLLPVLRKEADIRARIEFDALISEIKDGALDELDALLAHGEYK